MSKINIFFNNKDYLIDESAFSSASNKLKSHLLNVMNGSGAVINFDGTSYNVDSTKLSNVRNDFVSHLGTISGNGSKVSVNGIEYNVDSSKIASVVSELETVFGSLESDSLLYKLAEPTTFNGTSDFIDTGVKLYDEDKDFTILVDFTSGENTGLEHGILSCMNVNNSIYYGLNIDVGTANNALGMLARGGNGHISGTSSIFGVDHEDIQGMNIKMVIVKRGNTTTVKTKYDGVNGGQILSGNVGYTQFDNTLILGARYDIQHFWNGTINSCVIYNTVLSDEEVDEFLNFTTVEATSDIIWSETPAYGIDPSTGAVVSGQDYVSEMFTLEDGYVYELKQPTGGSWIRYVMYDAYGNFKYTNGVSGDGDLYIDSFGDNRLRITVYPASPDELDLNTVVPVKTDRIWSVDKYYIETSTGAIVPNGENNYITLQKIPVEGGATYKLSTSGTHQWLSWHEYAEDGTYLGLKETGELSSEALETTVNRNATHVILTVYGGESNVDDYATFVKTKDPVELPPIASDVVWSDTPTMNLHANTGEVTEDGNAYVSEPISLENG